MLLNHVNSLCCVIFPWRVLLQFFRSHKVLGILFLFLKRKDYLLYCIRLRKKGGFKGLLYVGGTSNFTSPFC